MTKNVLRIKGAFFSLGVIMLIAMETKQGNEFQRKRLENLRERKQTEGDEGKTGRMTP